MPYNTEETNILNSIKAIAGTGRGVDYSSLEVVMRGGLDIPEPNDLFCNQAMSKETNPNGTSKEFMASFYSIYDEKGNLAFRVFDQIAFDNVAASREDRFCVINKDGRQVRNYSELQRLLDVKNNELQALKNGTAMIQSVSFEHAANRGHLENQDRVAVFKAKKGDDVEKILSRNIRDFHEKTGINFDQNPNGDADEPKGRPRNKYASGGSTGCMVTIKKQDGEFFIKSLNVGDSQAQLVFRDKRNGKLVMVGASEEASPERGSRFHLEAEARDAGSVTFFGVARVNGVATARAFGDTYCKGISRNPDILKEIKVKDFIKELPDGLAENLELVSVMATSDAHTKIGRGSNDWAPHDVEVFAAKFQINENGVVTSTKFEPVPKAPLSSGGKAPTIGPIINAESWTAYVNKYKLHGDDNSATSVFCDLMEEGEEFVLAAFDGHGYEGHELADEGVEYIGRGLERMPSVFVRSDKEQDLSQDVTEIRNAIAVLAAQLPDAARGVEAQRKNGQKFNIKINDNGIVFVPNLNYPDQKVSLVYDGGNLKLNMMDQVKLQEGEENFYDNAKSAISSIVNFVSQVNGFEGITVGEVLRGRFDPQVMARFAEERNFALRAEAAFKYIKDHYRQSQEHKFGNSRMLVNGNFITIYLDGKEMKSISLDKGEISVSEPNPENPASHIVFNKNSSGISQEEFYKKAREIIAAIFKFVSQGQGKEFDVNKFFGGEIVDVEDVSVDVSRDGAAAAGAGAAAATATATATRNSAAGAGAAGSGDRKNGGGKSGPNSKVTQKASENLQRGKENPKNSKFCSIQ